MLRGAVVTAPDGHRWRVGRRWMDKPLPGLRERFKENSELAVGEAGLEALGALELADSPGAAIAIAVGAFLVCVVVLPLIGIAFELIVLALLLWSGIVTRILFGRPWIVEAVDLDDAKRSTAFAVKGWHRSGRVLDELRKAIATGGTPILYKPD